MDFSDALMRLKDGCKVARDGWNGKGIWLILVPGSTITIAAGRPLGRVMPHRVGETIEYRPHIDMFTADGTIVPWLASQTDLLADDWLVVS